MRYEVEGIHYVHAYDKDVKVQTFFINSEKSELPITSLDLDTNGDLHIYVGTDNKSPTLKPMKDLSSVVVYYDKTVIVSPVVPSGSVIQHKYPNDTTVWVHLSKDRPYSFFTLKKHFHTKEDLDYEKLLPFVKVFKTN